jgi:hypothetical protein
MYTPANGDPPVASQGAERLPRTQDTRRGEHAAMIIIRETFTAKPGMASKLATMMKDSLTSMPGSKTRVLTDMVGAFNTVVLETEANDIGEFEKRMKEYGERTDVREKMKGYTDLYETGKREIYRIV